MAKQKSRNWNKAKKLPLLEKGTYTHLEAKEGFPKNTKGTFEIVLLNGMHLDATVSDPVGVREELWWIATEEYRSHPQVRKVNGMISEVLVLGWKEV